MPRSVEGTYHNGTIELREKISVPGPIRVIVTFLQEGDVDLAARGISPEQAADLRARLNAFAEDWGRPETEDYDAL